jgi:hypothetical protein
MARTRAIVFEHDTDPDFSWLEQDHYNPSHASYDPIYPTRAEMKARRNAYDGDWYRNPDNHVALAMVAYDRHNEVTDSLGSIDFLADGDDWTTGTFYYVSDIPRACRYLRSLAREAGLPYRPRMKS